MKKYLLGDKVSFITDSKLVTSRITRVGDYDHYDVKVGDREYNFHATEISPAVELVEPKFRAGDEVESERGYTGVVVSATADGIYAICRDREIFRTTPDRITLKRPASEVMKTVLSRRLSMDMLVKYEEKLWAIRAMGRLDHRIQVDLVELLPTGIPEVQQVTQWSDSGFQVCVLATVQYPIDALNRAK